MKDNLELCGLSDRASVRCGDAMSYLRSGEKFDLIFLDPPYAAGLLGPALEEIARFDICREHGIIVAESALETATANSGELAGAILYVTANSERAAATLAAGYLWRAALAGAVVLLAEFIYIAVRYKLNMGAAAAISSLTGTLLTVALVALVRLPVTASLAYAGAFALLYTTVTSMLALNKMRENFKTDEYKEKSADEAIVSSLPVKTILAFAAVSAVALVLVGAIAVASVRWFAIASLIGVLAGTFASLIFMPAIYLPLKKLSDKRAAERARYDYKKSGKDKKEDAPKEDGKAAPTQA